MAERGEWPREGLVLGVLSFSFTKLSSLPSLKNGPPLCCFSVAWPLCFLLPLSRSPLFGFLALSPFQKLFPPLLVFQPSLLFSKTLLPLLLFSSPLPFSKTLPPSFSFPALPSVFKNSSPLFKNSLPFAAASKGSGAAACAWGAGDTKPG